ncbi:hypothetical protein [Thalassobaculum sp.]|uniref:hypothetical protein n=1 Tax=Thalassobaculum sp. TaxID=2022740 RepID=UPI0032EE7EFA
MGMRGIGTAVFRALLPAALVLAAVPAVPASAQQPDAEKAAHTRLFLDTFLTRCMPAAHAGKPVDTAGMTPVESPLAEVWLHGMEGSVWNPQPDMQVVMVVREAGGCLVLSALGDTGAVEAAVRERFGAAAAGFDQEHFKRTEDGGIQSFYRTRACPAAQGCRVIVNTRGTPGPGGLAMMAGAAQIKE